MISAVNCTPIKPNTSFKGMEQANNLTWRDYTNTTFKGMEQETNLSWRDYTNRIRNYDLKVNDIKEPVSVGGTLLAAGFVTFVTAQCVLEKALSIAAPKLGRTIEKFLQNNAGKVKAAAAKWAETPENGIVSKVKQSAGKVLGKTEDALRSIYCTVAYAGLPKKMVKEVDQSKAHFDAMVDDRASKALSNIAGVGVASYIVTDLFTRDSDNDGINDIWQRKHSLLSMMAPSSV